MAYPCHSIQSILSNLLTDGGLVRYPINEWNCQNKTFFKIGKLPDLCYFYRVLMWTVVNRVAHYMDRHLKLHRFGKVIGSLQFIFIKENKPPLKIKLFLFVYWPWLIQVQMHNAYYGVFFILLHDVIIIH